MTRWLTLILLATTLRAGTPPPLDALSATCTQRGFTKDICNPAPDLAPIIAFADADLENGNTGFLWATVIGIDFRSTLNDEHVRIPYSSITAICADHTTITDTDRRRSTVTSTSHRHYFRITTNDRTLTFWVPGGTSDTNEAATFYEHVLGTITTVTTCSLRGSE